MLRFKMLRENSGRQEVPRRSPKLPLGVCLNILVDNVLVYPKFGGESPLYFLTHVACAPKRRIHTLQLPRACFLFARHLWSRLLEALVKRQALRERRGIWHLLDV